MNLQKYKGKFLVQVYLVPFYFLIFMMFIHDPVDHQVWKERDFNLTVAGMRVDEVYSFLGEPNVFIIRDGLLILDYYDIVYPKKRDIRYKFVRLIFFDRERTVLFPKNIYYQE